MVFIVTLGIGPLARSLRESEERDRQRDVDVANLAQLNQFIVQHLRESILVVDDNNSIRLINESAGQLLRGTGVERGTPLGEVSPRLLYLLETWRKNAYDWQMSSMSLTSSDGGSMVQPHFVTDWPVTFAFGAADRAEIFGAWTVVRRIDRDVRPLFVSTEPVAGQL